MIAIRRFLLDAARACERGQAPPGLDPSIPYDRITSATLVAPADVPWEETVPLDPAFAP